MIGDGTLTHEDFWMLANVGLAVVGALGCLLAVVLGCLFVRLVAS